MARLCPTFRNGRRTSTQFSRPPPLTSRCCLGCRRQPRGEIRDPGRPRRGWKRLPPREDGAVVLVDGELGRGPQCASKRDDVRTGVPHNQDRAGIMTPVEQYPSAVDKGLVQFAKGLNSPSRRASNKFGCLFPFDLMCGLTMITSGVGSTFVILIFRPTALVSSACGRFLPRPA